MKYKYLSTFLLATALISLPQEIFAQGGKGKQMEDPFERTGKDSCRFIPTCNQRGYKVDFF